MKSLYQTASQEKIARLEQTFQQFKLKSDPLISETLLRLENYIENNSFCPLPKDDKGKMLFNMYKFYYNTRK